MSLVSVTAAEVEPTNVKWAWEGRVPLGLPTILAGAPGLGKTQLLIGACARATKGQLAGDLHGQAVDALYITAEDSLEHTLIPRFLAAGGDPHRVHFFRHKTYRDDTAPDASIQLPNDLPLIRDWAKRTGARILVLDPVVAFIPPNLNAHRDQHVRRVFAPVAQMADDLQLAVIPVMHLTKDREADALNRISGSIGFGGAARSVLLFGRDPDDPQGEAGNQRVLAHAKCNVGPQMPSVAYRIETRTIETANGQVQTSIAVRHGQTAARAADLLGNAQTTSEAMARSEARDFLLAELTDGPVASNEIRKRAEDAGISWRTIERARQQLSIRPRKTATNWSWELLPTDTPPDGIGGIGGLEPKTAKDANPAGTDNRAALADQTLNHVAQKFPDLAA